VNVIKYASQKYKIIVIRYMFFQAPNAPKSVFCRGSAPDLAGELTTLPRPLLGWWGVHPSAYLSSLDASGVSIASRRLRRIDSYACRPHQ